MTPCQLCGGPVIVDPRRGQAGFICLGCAPEDAVDDAVIALRSQLRRPAGAPGDGVVKRSRANPWFRLPSERYVAALREHPEISASVTNADEAVSTIWWLGPGYLGVGTIQDLGPIDPATGWSP